MLLLLYLAATDCYLGSYHYYYPLIILSVRLLFQRGLINSIKKRGGKEERKETKE